MRVTPHADGRYDVNEVLDEVEDWEFYHEHHGDIWQSTEWAVELLPALAAAIREGTP